MPKVLAAVSLFATLLAQRTQPPTFRAAIELVQVDVVVVDRNGTHVVGLTEADFTLLDRKKPQTIATFDEVAHHRPDAAEAPPALLPSVRLDVSSNQTAQSDRLIVVVVDDLHIYKERTDRAREITRNVVRDLGPQSSMAVLFTSQEHSTQVTSDRARLLAAVETLKGRQSWRRPHTASDAQTGQRIDPESPDPLAIVSSNQEARPDDFFDNLTQYKTLRDAARMLGAGDARRKAFVLVSEGIGKELSGLFGAMASPSLPPQSGAAYAAGNIEALTTVPPTGYHDFGLIDMMEAMRRSNVATYAIDPRGKVESKDLARECFPAPKPGDDPCSNDMAWHSVVRQAQHGLEITSEASGGFAVTNTDDFTGGLNRIVEDLDHYYLLGFYPADAKGKGYRPLEVKVAGHPDWKLRYRRGYMPGGPPAPAKTADPRVASSAGILPKTDLPLRLTAIAIPGTAALTRVALALEVSAPRRSLQEADGRVRDTLRYEVLVVDEKKARVRMVTGLEGKLTLSPAGAADAAPETVSYLVSDAIDIAPGHYEFRVSAQSAKLGKGGSVYLDVDVPDFRAAPVVIGGLAVSYADGSRVPVAPKAGPPVLPFSPSLDRAFTAADTLRVYFEASARQPRLTPTVEVVDAGGRVVRSPSPSFAAGDPMRVEATIPLSGLPPGPYIMRATLTDGRATATRDTGFAIK